MLFNFFQLTKLPSNEKFLVHFYFYAVVKLASQGKRDNFLSAGTNWVNSFLLSSPSAPGLISSTVRTKVPKFKMLQNTQKIPKHQIFTWYLQKCAQKYKNSKSKVSKKAVGSLDLIYFRTCILAHRNQTNLIFILKCWVCQSDYIKICWILKLWNLLSSKSQFLFFFSSKTCQRQKDKS